MAWKERNAATAEALVARHGEAGRHWRSGQWRDTQGEKAAGGTKEADEAKEESKEEAAEKAAKAAKEARKARREKALVAMLQEMRATFEINGEPKAYASTPVDLQMALGLTPASEFKLSKGPHTPPVITSWAVGGEAGKGQVSPVMPAHA